MKSFIVSTACIAGALAEGAAYSQCGGLTWTGEATCVSGYTCTYQSQYYSQCLPGTGGTSEVPSRTTTTIATSPETASSTSSTAASAAGFKWIGVDESGAEFGTGKYPGTWGVDYIFPEDSSIQVFQPLLHPGNIGFI
jgi:endoglucanase